MMTEDRTSRKRRWKKFFFRLSAALVVFITAVFLFLHTRTAGTLILRIADSALRKSAGLSLEARNIRFRPFALSVKFDDLTIRSVNPEETWFQTFTAERIELDAPWSIVLGKTIRLQKVLIVRPRFEAAAPRSPGPVPDASPEIGPPAEPESGTSAIPEIRIDAFDLIEGALTIDGGPAPFHLSLHGVEGAIRFDAPAKSHVAHLKIGGGRVAFEGESVGIHETGALLRFDGQTFFLDSFRLETAASSIEASGAAALFEPDPFFKIQARTSVSLEELLPFSGSPVIAPGRLDISAQVESRGSDVHYSGRIESRGVSFTDLGPASLHSDFEGNGSVLKLSDISFRSEAGGLEGRAELDLSGLGEFRIEARWDGLSLDRWAAAFQIEIPFDSVTSDGRIEARWPSNEFENIEAEASIRLKTAAASPTSGPQTGLSPSGHLDLLASRGRISGKGAVSAAGARLAFNGRIERMKDIDADFILDIPDIWVSASRLVGSETLAAAIPPGFGPVPETGGSAEVRGRLRGSLEDPQFSVSLEADGMALGDLRLSEVRAEAAGDAGAFDIMRMSAAFDGGRINGSGRIVLREGTFEPGPGTHGNLTISDVSLASFAALLPPEFAGDIDGILEGRADISLEEEGIRAEFRTGAAPLTLRGVSFDKVTARGRFEKDEFTVDSLTLESRDAALEGYFGWDTAGGGFHASLIGERIPLALAGALIPDGPQIEGTARFIIEGEGTFEEPRFTVSVSLDDVVAWDLRIPRLEFDAFGDGSAAAAILSVPSLNLKAEAGIAFEKPYNVHGRIAMLGMSPASLFSDLSETETEEHTAGAAGLSAEIVFDYPLLEPDGFQADGVFSTHDAGSLVSHLPGYPLEEPVSGTLEGRFSLRGNPGDIERLEAGLEFQEFQLAVGDLSIRSTAPFEFRLRDGRMRLEDLTLVSETSEAGLSATLTLVDEPFIEARLHLKTDLSRFDSLVPEARIGGFLEANLLLEGPAARPGVRGRAEFRDTVIRVRDFPLTLSGINGAVDFQDTAAVLSGIRGTANGGSFTLEGRVEHGGFTGATARGIRLALRDFNLTYPEGFRTLSEADLELNGEWGRMMLSGEVRVLQGLYREDIHAGIELLSLVRYSPPASLEDIPPLLRDVGLDIGVNSVEPIRVRNNLTDIELEVRLRLSGTPAFPLLSGRIRNTRFGQATFGDRRYTVETLTVEYMGGNIADFSIDVTAHTRVRYETENFDTTLRLSGPIDKPSYSLSYAPTSKYPNLSSQDLTILLLTGRMPADISGSALDTLGGRMITYFATPFTSPVTEGLKHLLKAEDVVIEPLNIASEADPGARFTFRKRVSSRAAVTYSVDITRSQRQTWILDYDLSRSFILGAFRKDDGTYGASFKHSFQFGGHRAGARTDMSAAAEGAVLASISFEGETVFPGEIFRRKTKRLQPGKPFSHGDLYAAVEDILVLHRDRGYANAVVSSRLSADDEGAVSVVLDIRPGTPAHFVFSGDSVPVRLRNAVRETWSGEFPERANLAESRAVLLDGLRIKRYFDAEVDAERVEEEGRISYIFTVRKGFRYRIRGLSIEGGAPLSDRDVKRTVGTYIMARTRGLWNLVIDTPAALAALKRRYGDLGFLNARIAPPVISADPESRRLDIGLHIDSGPRTMVQDVRIEGADTIGEEELKASLMLLSGVFFSPTRLQVDRNAVLTLYRSRGHQDVEVDTLVLPRPGEEDVDIVHEIREGPRHTLADLEVTGNTRTRSAFILKEAALSEGDPITLEMFARAKKRLYDSGVFRTVNISNRGPSGDGKAGDTVVIEVEEAAPFSVTYGLRFNSEEKFEGYGELSFANLLGGGRRGIFSYRENLRQTDLRFSLRSPYLLGIRFNTLYSLYSQTDVRNYFATETRGAGIQQEVRLPFDFSLSYLYRFNRIHTYELESWGPFPFDFTIDLSEVALNLVRDTRDDKFNPRAGSFFSTSLTYAPEALGSDLAYVSFFGQYTAARRLGRSFVWSAGIRLGLADAFDQVLIPSKRFFAGGGNSIRGFKLDAIGPIDPYIERPEGGEAVLVVNNELRFPLYGIFGAAVFHDFGNVYATARDLTLSDLRHGAGLGLRVDSPIGLLRFDLGFNLNPRPGEPRRVFFFSLGQAF